MSCPSPSQGVLTCFKGDNVSKKDPIRHSFYQTYREDPGRAFSYSIYQCEDAVAPDRRTASVQYMCAVDWTLDVPYSLLETFTNSKGERLKKLSYEIEMVPTGASVEFVLYIDGRKQESQNVKVNFQ